jgi:putative Holliday junction resolvase
VGRILALDVGTKTIGVATSDPLRMFAQPLTTLQRIGVVRDVEGIRRLIALHGVDQVVVGLPLELDGSEARSARLARQIGDALQEQGLSVAYVDERYSSVEAERHLIAADVSRKRRKEVIDQAAAMVILQSYLDERARRTS